MDKRFWCLCCEIPRPFLDLAGAEQHLAGVHGLVLAGAIPRERLRADGALVACMQLADGRAVLRMHTVRKRAFAYISTEPADRRAVQSGVEVLGVSGIDACYDRSLDLFHLADGDRVLCAAALVPSIDDCRYQHPPLLWSWLMCAACAQAATLAGRAAWRGATVGEAAVSIWSARSAAAYWYALALYEELPRTADQGYMVAVRVLRDGVAVAVRVAEADWQRGVIIDSDPVGVPFIEVTLGWGFVDDAACLTLDDSDGLTAERAACDAAALLALLEGEAVIKLLPNRPRLRPAFVLWRKRPIWSWRRTKRSIWRTDRRNSVVAVCSRDRSLPDTQLDLRLLSRLLPGTPARVPCLTRVRCAQASDDQSHRSTASISCNSAAGLADFRLPSESTRGHATKCHRKKVSDQCYPEDKYDLLLHQECGSQTGPDRQDRFGRQVLATDSPETAEENSHEDQSHGAKVWLQDSRLRCRPAWSDETPLVLLHGGPMGGQTSQHHRIGHCCRCDQYGCAC
jgi:hypothetical protein